MGTPRRPCFDCGGVEGLEGGERGETGGGNTGWGGVAITRREPRAEAGEQAGPYDGQEGARPRDQGSGGLASVPAGVGWSSSLHSECAHFPWHSSCDPRGLLICFKKRAVPVRATCCGGNGRERVCSLSPGGTAGSVRRGRRVPRGSACALLVQTCHRVPQSLPRPERASCSREAFSSRESS